ncbi:hypothetical protein SAMN05421823_108216 [Catalinimonas alkaloidigena]|uniref:Uncharacterized protein n=1 Tax=Catalinimonas alkaloidigena TaxID=1075417 RepID=A0A1G9N8X8_9BACT|nr:hypothetical protein [Catalinimonas alkaloidigena]SDL82870.1 hypothetical protein SAMN05421823_108216 [Catalinimonas alkaloidigena]
MQEGIHPAWFFLICLLVCNAVTLSLVIVLFVRQQRHQELLLGQHQTAQTLLTQLPRKLSRRLLRRLLQELPAALQHQLVRTQEVRQAAHLFHQHYQQYHAQLEEVLFLSKYADAAPYQQALNALAEKKRTLRESYRKLQGVAHDPVLQDQSETLHERCNVLFDDVMLYAHGYLGLLRNVAHRNFAIDHHTQWSEAQKEQQRTVVAHERLAQTQEYLQHPTQRLLRDEITGHLAQIRADRQRFAERMGLEQSPA